MSVRANNEAAGGIVPLFDTEIPPYKILNVF